MLFISSYLYLMLQILKKKKMQHPMLLRNQEAQSSLS